MVYLLGKGLNECTGSGWWNLLVHWGVGRSGNGSKAGGAGGRKRAKNRDTLDG